MKQTNYPSADKQKKDQPSQWNNKRKPKNVYRRRSPGSSQPEANSPKLRPVFAAYLNMARANLFAVLKHISVLNGLPVNKDEEHLEQLPVARFSNHKQPEVRQKVYTLLYKHIPILKQMSQAYITKAKPAHDGKPAIEEHKFVTQADLQELLQNIIRTLNYLRNDFTHADHYNTKEERDAEFQREANLFRPMSYAFMGSKRETARIFCYKAQDMYFVDQGERMKRTDELTEEGKPIYRECEDWYFRLYTRSAKFIRNDQGDHEVSDDSNSSDEANTLQLTTAGLVFFISKFLHKKFATQMAQQTGLFRTKDQSGYSPFTDRENEIMFNIFCAHRIRLPKGRIESTADKSALGLDMLNELQKCPQELFDTFSPEDRRLFQIVRADGSKTPTADDDINLFRRSYDRFASLAMKYIDAMRTDPTEQSHTEAGPLSSIVFQIALGKYRYKFYNRASLDTKEENRVRVLQKEINGFGPLPIVESLRDGDTYATLIRKGNSDNEKLYEPDNAKTKPYLTDHHASYAITGERIGLMWGTKKDGGDGVLTADTLCYLPYLPMPTLNNDGSWTVEKDKMEHNVTPRAWLSIYDLPALVFLHLIGGNPEKVIKDTYKNLKKLLNDIEKGKLLPFFEGQLETRETKAKEQTERLRNQLANLLKEKYNGIRIKDIPDKLVEYLTAGAFRTQETVDKEYTDWVNKQLVGYSEDKDSEGHIIHPGFKGIIQSLDDRIKKFEKDLNTVGDKQNRLGRKSYVDIRPGSLARYLSKDIVRLTIPDAEKKNGGKPTGLDFAVLQSSIATFAGNGLKLKDTPLGAILLQAIHISSHPFLADMMDQRVNDTIAFYRIYQKKKLAWLKNRHDKKDYLANVHFQHYMREAYRNHAAKTAEYVRSHDEEKGENIVHVKGLAERYFDTLQLPNGLFTDAIRTQLATNKDTRENPFIKAALADTTKGHSAAYLLNIYFTKVLMDKPQAFYRNQGDVYKRHYKLLDVLYHNSNGDTYMSENDIANKLKKGQSRQAPIRKQIDAHIKNLQMEVGKVFDKQKKKMVSVYGPADDHAKSDEYVKLMHQLRDLQRNEQAIRRYRNEDMLLFLMAKRLLLAGGKVFEDKVESEGMQKFHLQDITPPAIESDETRNMLEISIDFSVTIGMNDEEGKAIMSADGKQVRRTIRQKDIKLKNYGDFFAFLYDSRIGGLLSQMPDSVVECKDLQDELDSYDRQRLKVFAVLQAIERQIIKQHPELSDSNAAASEFRTSKGVPYRNSFSGLLSLCQRYLKSEDKSDLNALGESVVDVRNAFSHNRYTCNDNEKIDISKMSLPQVAQLILKWLEKNR